MEDGINKAKDLDWELHDLMAQLARTHDPKSYLEIGVREGDSLRAVMDNCNLEVAIVCDTWKGECGGTDRGDPGHIVEILKNVPEHVVITGESQKWLFHVHYPMDLVLVDGSHWQGAAEVDIINAKKIFIGQIIVVHDLDYPGYEYLMSLFLKHFGDDLVYNYEIRDTKPKTGIAYRRDAYRRYNGR